MEGLLRTGAKLEGTMTNSVLKSQKNALFKKKLKKKRILHVWFNHTNIGASYQ